MEWETVYESVGGCELLERFKVPAGWLYRSTQWLEGEDKDGDLVRGDRTESMCFVPERP